MFDLHVVVPDAPGSLALIGETLAARRISVEGGGIWAVNGVAHGHYLFRDGEAARQALQAAGVDVAEVRRVTILRLHQDIPGQLGKIAQRMAHAGVNIEVQYSDHDHQLVLITDQTELADRIAAEWMANRPD